MNISFYIKFIKGNYKRPPFIMLYLFLLILLAGLKNKVVFHPDDFYSLFYPSDNIKSRFQFHFKNSSNLLRIKKYQKLNFRAGDPAHAVVADYNKDGFEDVLLIYIDNKERNKVTLLTNDNGKAFTPSHELEIYLRRKYRKKILAAAFVDIDNDGWVDLIFTIRDGIVTFLKNHKGTFVPNPLWPDFKSDGDKRNINLLDANNDGFVDIYFTSYLNSHADQKYIPLNSNGNEGGKNILLLNRSGKGFEDVTDAYGVGDRGFSWTAALSDFNQDGYPDILVINDYGYNQYFENENGKRFLKKTREASIRTDSSFSMSGDVGDYNHDGKFDVYISNVNRPTLLTGYNQMLLNGVEGPPGSFKDVSEQMKVDRCGWSWGVRSFESDLDGRSAFFVVNSPNFTQNQIARIQYYSSPIFLRKLLYNFDSESLHNLSFSNKSLYPQKNCLFYLSAGEYRNIAEEVGINDVLGGRGVVETDFDNDGYPDFIVTNIDASPLFYTGTYRGANRWIGFNLSGTVSNRDAIGATVTVKYRDFISVKQIFPTNGYNSQNTKRLVFGVPNGNEIREIVVKWPSGREQRVSNYQIGRYNDVVER